MFPYDFSFWLKNRLACRRAGIMALLARLTGLGPRGGLSTPLMGCFLKLVDQIAEAKAEESQLLDRIDEIEARHRFNRLTNRLQYASASHRDSPAPIQQASTQAKPEQPKGNLLWLAALWYALKPQRQ